jgi:negative regulator of sigma E activity
MTGERDRLIEQLSAYLDEELAPDERAEIEARLERDADARRLLEELRLLSRTLAEETPPELPAGLVSRIGERLPPRERNEAAGRVPIWRRPAWIAGAATAAACVVAAVVVHNLPPDERLLPSPPAEAFVQDAPGSAEGAPPAEPDRTPAPEKEAATEAPPKQVDREEQPRRQRARQERIEEKLSRTMEPAAPEQEPAPPPPVVPLEGRAEAEGERALMSSTDEQSADTAAEGTGFARLDPLSGALSRLGCEGDPWRARVGPERHAQPWPPGAEALEELTRGEGAERVIESGRSTPSVVARGSAWPTLSRRLEALGARIENPQPPPDIDERCVLIRFTRSPPPAR